MNDEARIAIAVVADAPLPERCKPELLGVHEASWAAKLHAAMLRDTLDGLQSIDADDWVVIAPDDDALALATLERHVPSPWRVSPGQGADPGARLSHASKTSFDGGADIVVLASSSVPTFDVAPLVDVLGRFRHRRDGEAEARRRVALAPTDGGNVWAFVLEHPSERLFVDLPWGTNAVLATLRARCRELGLDVHELAESCEVERPSDVLRLIDELRKHPERAPRTAQFLVTSG